MGNIELIRLNYLSALDMKNYIELQHSVANKITYEMGFINEKEAMQRIVKNFVFFIKKDGVLVGSLEYRKINDCYTQIYSIVVIPPHQGKGIGKEALSIALANISETIVGLTTHSENIYAEKLYRSLGFYLNSSETAPTGKGHHYKHFLLMK
jgi:ribosomal protein S18 acetylase RimI-like enzyme